MLRREFEPKNKKVTGGWRKLQNVELYVLISSPISSIIRMIKYLGDEMGRACNTHEEDEKWNRYRILFRKTSRDHFGDVGVDGRTILKMTLKKCALNSFRSGQGRQAGSCESGKRLTKSEEFLE